MDKFEIDLGKIPTYGFQFALSNLGSLKNSFIRITFITVGASLLGFYGTYLLSELISKLDSINKAQISTYYIPAFLLAYSAKEFLEFLTRKNGEPFATVAGNKFQQSFFEAVLKSEASVLSNVNKEELLAACTRYLARANAFLSGWVWNTSRNIVQFILVLIILASQSFYVCLGSIVYLLLFLTFALSLSRRFAPFAQAVAEAGQAASHQITQSYLASATIRRLRLEDFFLGKLRLILDEQTNSTLRAQRFHAQRWFIQLNAFNLLYIGTLFYGIYQVKSGLLPLGFLLLIRYAFERLWDILVFVIEKYVGLVQEREEAKILRKLLAPLVSPASVMLKKHSSTHFDSIEIEGLSLSIKDKKRASSFHLSVPNLKIYAGDKISLKAPSGNGKTTFLLSLMNLVPFDGKINFNDQDLKSTSIAPSLVSYISPSEPLFPLSLAENITLGRECRQETIDTIMAGLGINEFVKDPSAILGQAATNLSLGQSQRIRLARALLLKSPLLLLDEPFTGLDFEAREKIKLFILDWCKDSTIIVASHDEEDRMLATRHLYIRNGVLLEFPATL